MRTTSYLDKYNQFDRSLFLKLEKTDQEFIEKLAFSFGFTYQEFHQSCTMARELAQWNEGPFASLITKGHEKKSELFLEIRQNFQLLKSEKTYEDFKGQGQVHSGAISTSIIHRPEAKILGSCPVASEKTLCCNLETLDAVRNCGLECSYCSIQSFYSNNEVIMDAEFRDKLMSLHFDKDKLFHIGTGQSSDSLMWGNKEGMLDHLIFFAQKNPNVILEFKTKSSNVDYLIKNKIPKNILTTWSLNPDIIIANEEHKTAKLDARLKAARKVADQGRLVGFHFHPMIHYDHFKEDYAEVVDKVTSLFKPSEVALISLGTVTFTKKVIKEIRSRNIKSKILQMPFNEVAGKFSYPEDIKREMFSHLYNAFSSWHEDVFFYLCMEPMTLWPSVFHKSYKNNADFEEAMKGAYWKKIQGLDD